MNDMNDQDSNILARIDERTKAQVTSFALYVKDSGERFDKIDSRFDKIEGKIEPLQNESNQRKGAIGMSRFLSAGFYSVLALAAGYFGGQGHK